MEQILDWVQFAMQTEERGMRFYAECAKTDNHYARELFTFLVKEEGEHRRLLSQLYRRLSAGKEPQTVPQPARNPLFDLSGVKQIRDAPLTEMFNTAMELEDKGITLYTGYMHKAQHPRIKALFARLIKDEHEHKTRIAMLGSRMLNTPI